MKATKLPGHGKRQAIAYAVGVTVAVVAMLAVYYVVFAKGMPEFEKAGETGRIWWILAFVGLVVGSAVQSVTFKALDRRARRAAEAARLPPARIHS